MMVGRGRRARYTAEQALRAVMEEDDDSEYEDSDFSNDEVDHCSEPSDQSDTETAEPAAKAANQAQGPPQANEQPRRDQDDNQVRGQIEIVGDQGRG